ncbi:unnamed protein product, partial [Musa textilis]
RHIIVPESLGRRLSSPTEHALVRVQASPKVQRCSEGPGWRLHNTIRKLETELRSTSGTSTTPGKKNSDQRCSKGPL